MSPCTFSIRALSAAFLFIGLLLGSRTALGQLTALEVDPPSPCVASSATFKVVGDGASCAGSLDFGDGTPPQAFSALPFETPHTYAAAGTFTANATSPSCGSASLTVETRSCRPTAGRAPDRTIRRKRRAVGVPRIEGVLTFGIAPGADLLVGGRFFGDTPGRVKLLGLNGQRDLVVESWTATGVAGKVPQDVDAICATGNLVVETAAGQVSNRWFAQVVEEEKALPPGDVTVVACGTDGNENRCNDQGDDGDLCVEILFPPWFVGLDREGQLLGDPSPSAIGVHSNCWGAVGDDSGTDTYRIALKNGWTLQRAEFLSSVPDGEGSTTPPSGSLPAGFARGASSWEPSIQWSVTPGDAVIYNLYVTIRGPACASHK